MTDLHWVVLFVACIGILGLGCLTVLLWQTLQIIGHRRWTARLRLQPLLAYVKRISVTEGEGVELCIHSEWPGLFKVSRMGAELVDVGRPGRFPRTIQPGDYDYWKGCQWKTTTSIETQGLASGMYLVELRPDEGGTPAFRLAFLVKPQTIPDIAVVSSTNTWQAYNAFAGLSNYEDRVTPWPLAWLMRPLLLLNFRMTLGNQRHLPAVPLPDGRPNLQLNDDLQNFESHPGAMISHLARAECELLQFLDLEGCKYGVYSDRDFAFDPLVTRAKLIVFNVHSEYWSEEMVGRLSAYLDGGGHVFFLSGNNLYRRVQFLEWGTMVYDFNASAATAARLVGGAYDARGYKLYGGYRVGDAAHWVFQGLNVRDGDLFAFNRNPADGVGGASGYETDKIRTESHDATILAIGENPEGPAFFVYCQKPRGGWVVNSGSVASAMFINRDAVLAGMVRNIIRRALNSDKCGTEPYLSPTSASLQER